jgi:flagellin
VNGLTFTPKAGGGTVAAADIAAAFASLTSGMSAAEATSSHPTSAGLGTYTGKFTEGFTTGLVSTATVTATATDDNQGNVADISVGTIPMPVTPTRTQGAGSGGATESSVITFPALAAGQRVTINGLSYTANAALTSTQTAAAFASITPTNVSTARTADQVSTANAASAALGSYSGTWAAGFQTGTNTGAVVTATYMAASTVATEITYTTGTNPTRGTVVDGVNVPASTAYGTVTLNSINAFTVRPGANAYPNVTTGAMAADSTFANFTALGFKAETINPKNIGRLSFQVGPSPDQLISIDLADFGKNGDITGAITSDKAPTNILSVQAANDVTQSVNKSLDMISMTRASMGAVMNRLEHVIDNLTNVVMNSEASRSQIEDADYAAASTELARTQIMQQAATAVLAQANTSQQSVLKLLQQ